MPWYRGDFAFPGYVSVATRRARARVAAEKVARRQKRALAPVGPLTGTRLARTFWGKAWCHNLESYRDYENRLPRGRSYLRHGAVIDLQVTPGRVTALVTGTSIYEVTVTIQALATPHWRQLASDCTQQIDSLVDLLRGKLPASVMERVTRKADGLFPAPKEITFACSCPDWAGLCKHVAATLYGVGVRLEEKPELLFHLRGVDHTELVGGAADAVPALVSGTKARGKRKVIQGADLSALFGIELEGPAAAPPAAANKPAGGRRVKGATKATARKRR